MKIKVEMDQNDLRNAVGNYVKGMYPDAKEVDVSFTVHEADDDPRSPRAAYVTATIECS